MTSGQKTAVSLLVSVLVFAACLAAALLGGFDFIEIRYYEPRIVQNVNDRLDKVSENFDSYIENLEDSFASYAGESSISSYIERDCTQEDAENRVKLTTALFDRETGLDGIRLVEADGIKMHFSTYASDVLTETEEQISYRPYNTINELPFFLISTTDNGEYASNAKALKERCSVYYDGEKERLVIGFPYFDHYTAYRGTLLFYVNADDFLRSLIASNTVALNTRSALIAPVNADANYETAENTGFVFGIPYNGRSVIKTEIEAKWNKQLYGVEQLAHNENTDRTLLLITGQKSKYVKMGWVCDESEFSFSPAERTLILICIFITVFLIIFLVFNLKHDDMTVIQGRVHKFQKALITEYIQRKDKTDWNQIARELNYRKVDVDDEIKKSLGRKGKKYSKELDALLDESWNQLFAAVGGVQSYVQARNDTIGAASVKNDVKIASPAAAVRQETVKAAPVPEAEPVEELEEIADAEPVEDLEEVAEAEPVEELEEIADAEPVEELEEIADAEPVEDLEEVADAEPVEELEEIADAEPVEELEEVPEAEPVEELEEVSEAAPAEEVKEEVQESVKTPEPEPVIPAFNGSAPSSPAVVDELEEIGSFEKKTVNQDPSLAEKLSIQPLDFTDLDTLSEEELKTQKEKKPEQIDL